MNYTSKSLYNDSMSRVKKFISIVLLVLISLSTFVGTFYPKAAYAAGCESVDSDSPNISSISQPDESKVIIETDTGDKCTVPRYTGAAKRWQQAANRLDFFSANTNTYLRDDLGWGIAISRTKPAFADVWTWVPWYLATYAYVYSYTVFPPDFTTNVTPIETTLTKGAVAGFVSPQGWKQGNPTEVLPKYKLTLLYDNQILTSRQVQSNGSQIWYDSFTLSLQKFFGKPGLPEGTYTLVFDENEPYNSGQGGAAGLATGQLIRTVYKGETKFKLSKNAGGGTDVEILTPDYKGAKKKFTLPNSADAPPSGEDLINVYVTERTVSPLDAALEKAIVVIMDLIEQGIKFFSGVIFKVLFFGNDIASQGELIQAWAKVRNLSLSLLTLGILLIAFANVLSVDLEKYGITRMIPRLVMAIVMSYFSFLMARFLLELSGAFVLKLLGPGTINLSFVPTGVFEKATKTDILENLGATILLALLGIFIVIALIWLAVVLVVRIMVVWFLVALAPLAFLMLVMPFTEPLFHEWWTRFWKWVFIGPAAAFMIWFATIFMNSFAAAFKASAGDISLKNPETFIYLFMAAAAIFLAASLPLTMGKEVLGALGKYGGAIGKKTMPYKLWQAKQKTKEERSGRRVQRLRAGISKVPFVGRRMAGVNRAEAGALRGESKASVSKLFGQMSKEDLNNYMGSTMGRGLYSKMAVQAAAEKGLVDNENNDAMATAMAVSSRNPDIEHLFRKNQPELFAEASMAGIGGEHATRIANALANSTNPQDMHRHQVQHISQTGDLRHLIGELTHSQQSLTQVLRKDARTRASWGETINSLGHQNPQQIQTIINNSADPVAAQRLVQDAQGWRDSHEQETAFH